MRKEERNGSFDWAFLVDKVDLQRLEIGSGLDVGGKLGQLVDLGFSRSPVILVFPIRSQALNVFQRGSIGIACTVELIWEADNGEFLMERRELMLRYGYFVGLDSSRHFVRLDIE